MTTSPTAPRLKTAAIVWLIAALALIAISYYPIRAGSERLVIIGLGLLLWLLPLWTGRRLKPVRVVAVLSLAVVLWVAVFPGRADSPENLRPAYVAALENYVGTPFVWGGETRRGVDCSGFVRRGMIDMLWKYGWHTANPAMIRQAIALWYFDSSASALGDGYRGNTVLRFKSLSLNSTDYREMRLGDVAVTANGVHTLAYIGISSWIEADPSSGKVVIMGVPSTSGWFRMPVKIVRWQWL